MFDGVQPLPQLLPDPPLPSLVTQLCLLFSFKSVRTSLCSPNSLPLQSAQCGRGHTLKKTVSFPNSSQLPTSPHLGVGLYSPLHAGIRSGVGPHRSFACCCSYFDFLHAAAPLCLKTLFPCGRPPLLALRLFWSLFCNDPEPCPVWGGGLCSL